MTTNNNNTGQPLNYRQLQAINNKYFPAYKIEDWEEYGKLKNQGASDKYIQRAYKNAQFKKAFGDREDYNELKRKSDAERDYLYLSYYLGQNDTNKYKAYLKEVNPDKAEDVDNAWASLEKESRIELYNNANPSQKSDLVKYAVRDLLYASDMNYGVGANEDVIHGGKTKSPYTEARWAKRYLEHFSEYPADIQAEALQYTGYSFDDIKNSETFANVANERNRGGYNKSIKYPSIWNMTGVSDEEMPVSGTALEYMQEHFRADVLSNAKRNVANKLPVSEGEANVYNKYIKDKVEESLPYYYADKDGFIHSPDGSLIPTVKSEQEEKLKQLNQQIDEARAIVLKNNLVIPYTNNPFAYGNLTLDNFKQIVAQIAPEYAKYAGSKWAPDSQINYEQLYDELKDYIESGQVGYASDYLTKHLEKILGKNQAGWFESGDNLLPSKREVFLRSTLGKTVESLLNVVAEPLGFIYGAGAMATGENFWEYQSKLPNVAHEIYKSIKGENSVVFNPDTFSDYLAQNGETLGAFAALVIELAIAKKLPAATALSAEKAASTTKALNTYLVLESGIDEASGDALELREGIINKGIQERENLINKKANEYSQYFNPNRPYDANRAEQIFQELWAKESANLYEALRNPSVQDNQHFVDLRTDADINHEVNEILKTQAIVQAQAEHWFNESNQNYDDYVMHQANTAYGRTLIQEALIVDMATLLGLGAEARLVNARLIKPMTWPILKYLPEAASKIENTLIQSGKFGKATAYTGKVLGKGAWSTLTEIPEELGQEHVNQFQRMRAERNIENYAEGLHYGFGADLVAAQELGFLEGVMDLGPEAWSEVDKEDIIKSVASTTLLLGSVHMPGRGKSREQIRIDNNSRIGEVFDYIRKYFPYHSMLGSIAEELKAEMYDKPNIVQNGFEHYYNDAKTTEVRQSIAAAINIGAQMIKAAEEGNVEEYQKQQSAYQASLAVMLDNLNKNNPVYAKHFIELLENRANANKLSRTEQDEILQQWLDEASTNDMKNISREEQLNFMTSSNQEVLNLLKEAESIRRKLENNEQLQNIELRPLIFAELLNNLVPKVITENWKQLSAAVDKVLSDNISDEKFKSPAYQYVINNYFKESDFNKRSDTLNEIKQGKIKDIKKEDLIKAFNDISSKLSMEVSNVNDILKSDVNLTKWRNDVYKEWESSFKKALEGENIVSNKKIEEKVKAYSEEAVSNKNAKIFQQKVVQAKTVQELRNIYQQELAANEDRKAKRQYDVTNALRSIENPETKKLIKELDEIEKAKSSLQSLIQNSNLSDELKDNLYDQLEDMGANVNNVDALYDISNYRLRVDPEEHDKIAGQLQEIINNAKNLATTAQNTVINPVTEQKGATQNPAPADLGPNRDVDTAPAVNKQPINKLSVDEAKEKINKANSFIKNPSENGFDNVQNANDAANKLIEEVKTKCPENYKVVVGGNGVALISVQPSTTVKGTFNVETGKPVEDKTTPTFVQPEDVIEEEIPYEDIIPIDTSIEVYPDSDVRSITRIAVGRYSEEGNPYTFAIRDENVQNGDRAETSYTDKNGKVHTGTTGPLEIISIEEFNKRRESNPKDYNKSLEELAQLNRPKYVSKTTNQEVSKVEVENGKVVASRPANSVIYTDDTFIARDNNNVEINVGDFVTKRGRGKPMKVTRMKLGKRQGMSDAIFIEVDNSGMFEYFVTDLTVSSKNPENIKETKTTVKTNRTEAQQQRLNNNITPARNEISAQFLPKEKDGYQVIEQGKEYTRLGDEAHRNIDSQLEEQGAFEYRNSGRLQVGDEIQFVVSEEEMPDGTTQPVIWEVTKPKDKQIPEDSKFKGMQVLSVLDQTNMTGDRLALIERIRKAYDEAGRPESFLYDKESFKITNIVNGVIPFVQTNPTEAKSNTTIESTNLKKGLIKSNGKWGMSFWNQKLGKMIHFPVTFKQVIKNSNGGINEIISDSRVTNIEDIKHEYASQSNTREVMLITITPTGYKAAHSVYVMRRDIENAVDKYIQAIKNGELGKELINRMTARLTDNNAITHFNDFFRFNNGISERVYFDKNHNRLELGYFNNGQYTTLLYAKGIGNNKYVITEQDARNVLNDNEGKGFSFDEIAREYLTALVQNETVGASVQINMDAITKDHSIVDALIEDGFLWAPNSINARFGMENTGFSAPINQEAQTISKEKIKQEPKSETKTAPVEETPTPITTPSMKSKQQVPKTIKKDHAMRVKRKKLTANDTLETESPNPVNTQEISPVSTENTINAILDYNNLNAEQKQHITEKGFTQETFDKLTQLEKENVLNC